MDNCANLVIDTTAFCVPLCLPALGWELLEGSGHIFLYPQCLAQSRHSASVCGANKEINDNNRRWVVAKIKMSIFTYLYRCQSILHARYFIRFFTTTPLRTLVSVCGWEDGGWQKP